MDAAEFYRLACKAFSTIYVCIDTLDERCEIVPLLQELCGMPSYFKLFATGQKHVQEIVEHNLEGILTVPIKAQDKDICLFIKSKIDEDCVYNPDIMNQNLENEIMERIISLSNGM